MNRVPSLNKTVLDLFCGAGGMGLGFAQAGFTISHAIDNYKAAVETYRANLGEHIEARDLGEALDLPKTDLIVGGPPCQGFSSAGVRRVGDVRNSLVSQYANIIVHNRPLAFVFENVEGFLTAEHGERVFDLLVPLVDAGYHIHLRKINAAEYGVPQHRKRVIAIGGLGWRPEFPAPTHRPFGAPGVFAKHADLPPTPTLADALAGLGPAGTVGPGQPQGHYTKPLTGDDAARAAVLEQGQKMRDLPPELRHESYNRRAFRRVQDGTDTARRGGAPTGIRRLRADEPSKTITGGARSEFIHPTEPRNLTIRECARLQTFPDDFEFKGALADQIQLIGNAVPPQFARVLAESLARQMQQLPAQLPFVAGPGSLLSFVPTDSAGYSPALRQVTDKVQEIFNPPPAAQAPPTQVPAAMPTPRKRAVSKAAPKSPKNNPALPAALRKLLNSAKSKGKGVSLSVEQCTYLLLRIAEDLGLRQQLTSPGPEAIAEFYSGEDPATLAIADRDNFAMQTLFHELFELERDTEVYFDCLSALQKRRLKYTRILQYQPIPTITQVGPRGLLQYGSLSNRALSALLFWRKWMFDIDNRAGQETGYVFEPMVVSSIGGEALSAKDSPVRRRFKPGKRQVDCLVGNRAYEIKLRITVAASGQGRWSEEKDFPADCKESGLTPVLIVFDDTQADKLDELVRLFREAGGEAYVGQAAWDHLEQESGPTMAIFVERYVRQPIAELLEAAPDREALPNMSLVQTPDAIIITIDGEELHILRPKDAQGAADIAEGDPDAVEALVEDGTLPESEAAQLTIGFEPAAE